MPIAKSDIHPGEIIGVKQLSDEYEQRILEARDRLDGALAEGADEQTIARLQNDYNNAACLTDGDFDVLPAKALHRDGRDPSWSVIMLDTNQPACVPYVRIAGRWDAVVERARISDAHDRLFDLLNDRITTIVERDGRVDIGLTAENAEWLIGVLQQHIATTAADTEEG